MKTKLIRITTIPRSLKVLLKGQHQFMSSKGLEVIGISSKGKELEEVSTEEGIKVKAIELSRKITPIKDIKSLWETYIYLKKEKPTIVHTHTPKAGIIGMLAAKLAGVPLRLHTVAGLPLMEATGKKRKVLDFVEKLTYYSATNVYPNSKGLYDFILANNFTSSNKLKVIGKGSSNGINTEFFNPKEITENEKLKLKKDLDIKDSDFVFIFIGRLVGDKGINELIKAFSLLNISKSKLLLVGTLENDLDPLRDETITEIKNNANIISVGFQKDVRPYLSISNALVFPSYREGFPNVVMQAGAMGLPSIVSNINGCNEIIINKENGIIVPVKNSEALQEAMEIIMTNDNLYSQLKINAREYITSRYEQKVVWEAILQEYNHLINQLKK